MLCKYGCGQKATFKDRCCEYSSKCPVIKNKNSEAVRKVVMKRISNGTFISNLTRLEIPWNKGLKKETDERVKKSGEAVSKSLLGKKQKPRSLEDRLKTSNKMREKILERYKNGWEPVCGRCKKLDYYSPVAGNIKVDGSWELKVAKYLDTLGIKWKRNKKRFNYFNYISNRDSTYCPDFYIDEWNCYIEVKGYKTELDECKWKQFKDKIEVWDKQKLKSLHIL